MEGSEVLDTFARNLVIKRNTRCADSLMSVKPELTVAQITGKSTRNFHDVFQGNPIEVAIFQSTKETDMTEEHLQKYGPGRGRGVIENDVFHVLFMFGNEKYAVFAFRDSKPNY